ncbi:MAG: DNRLRE domain-containing protein [Chloroflexota bacterium]|nr:DNRLRE domain-containing protein [Chloroflexota bacterium]
MLSVVIGIIVAGATFTSSMGAKPVAAATGDQIYWGALISGAPDDVSRIDTFEARANKKMSIQMFGVPWQMNGHDMSFPLAYMNTIRNRGTVPVLDWGSHALGSGVNQPNFTLASITNGNHDAYITQFAQAAAAWKNPFFLRFDAEMNGWWLPWSEQTNGNKPGDYARAWRHVVDIFRAQGANNVTWVWCPNLAGSQSTSLDGLYPGDNYVDWTAMDGYNYGTDRNNQPQSFAQLFGYSVYDGGFNTYQMLQTLAPTKPIMIAETASSETGGSKSAWITDAFASQLQTNFPLIKAVMWFEWNDNDPLLSWPIESSGTAQAAFAAAIASAYYATNQFAGLNGSGPIKPLGSVGVSPTATPVPPTATPTSNTASFKSIADTYTSRSAPYSVAGGTSTELRVDETGSDTTFLKFDLSAAAGKTIASAKVRIKTSSEAWAPTASIVTAHYVDDTGWWEKYMSYTNSVPMWSTVLGTLNGAPATNTWYEISLDPAPLQNNAGSLMSMALQGSESDVLLLYSREAGPANAPQLMLTYK